TLFSLVGMEKKDAYETLNITEDQDLEKHAHRTHLFVLKEEKELYGEKLKLGFYIDPEDSKVWGIEFFKEFGSDAKKGYDLTKSLYSRLQQEFGEPTTPTGQPIKVSDLPNFEEIEKLGSWSGGEEWNMENGFTLFLMPELTLEHKYTAVRIQYSESINKDKN